MQASRQQLGSSSCLHAFKPLQHLRQIISKQCAIQAHLLHSSVSVSAATMCAGSPALPSQSLTSMSYKPAHMSPVIWGKSQPRMQQWSGAAMHISCSTGHTTFHSRHNVPTASRHLIQPLSSRCMDCKHTRGAITAPHAAMERSDAHQLFDRASTFHSRHSAKQPAQALDPALQSQPTAWTPQSTHTIGPVRPPHAAMERCRCTSAVRQGIQHSTADTMCQQPAQHLIQPLVQPLHGLQAHTPGACFSRRHAVALLTCYRLSLLPLLLLLQLLRL